MAKPLGSDKRPLGQAQHLKLAKRPIGWYLIWHMFGEIKNQQGEKIDYSVHAGESRSDFIAIIGHGVTGNKDRPFILALAEGLEAAGIPTLRMSFAGNGGSGGRFVDCTISKETEDLGSVIDAVGERKICYIGHSMGGAVGVKRTSSDARIDALVSLAGMVHTQEFAQREFGEETPDEGCMWEEESCPLSSTYMNDMAALNSLADLGGQITVPWLLVHGTEDDVVPIIDSNDIIAKATNNPEFFEIAGADHVFSDEALPVMVAKVVEWVKAQAG
ncbi:MAG: alpha/beta hydrolase [Verrucomicrobiales bacterium]|nr:alpha/beta hydrolase [Verrucomicrobiales bacterium]